MSRFYANTAIAALMFVATSCSSDSKKSEQPDSSDKTTITHAQPSGEAGGSVEEVFTAAATISAIDPSTRRVTLVSADGVETSFTAGPEVRNFDQMQIGDKVIATITERLDVFVRSDGAEPSASHAAALSAARKGAKPGVLVAEAYEIVATVQAIDATNRTATLKFVDGQTKTVPVRPHVDLSRYKVGDSVVIRVTATLAVLVETP